MSRFRLLVHAWPEISLFPQARGIVIFARGRSSSRHNPRNRQVASALQRVSLVALISAVLFVRSLRAAYKADPGVDPDHTGSNAPRALCALCFRGLSWLSWPCMSSVALHVVETTFCCGFRFLPRSPFPFKRLATTVKIRATDLGQ